MTAGVGSGPRLHDSTIACLPLVAARATPADAATLARSLRDGFDRLEVLNPYSFAILSAQGVNPWDWIRAVRRAAPGIVLSVALSDLRGLGTPRMSPIAVADVVFVMEKEGIDLFRLYLEDGGVARRDALLDAPGSGAQVVPVILGVGAAGLPPPGLEDWKATFEKEAERSWIALTGSPEPSHPPPGMEAAGIEFWGWTSKTHGWMSTLARAPWLMTATSVIAERLLLLDPEILALWGTPLQEKTREALGVASLALRRILKVRAPAEESAATPMHGERVHLPGIVRAGPPVFSSMPFGPDSADPRSISALGLMEDAALSVLMLPDHSARLIASPPTWAGQGVRRRAADARSPPGRRTTRRAGGEEWLTSPMPGRVLEIKVRPGDQVKTGDHLLTLEAMKMQNHLAAPRDGRVESVNVAPGERVAIGQKLVRIVALTTVLAYQPPNA